MNEIEIDLSKCIDNFKIDKDKAKQYGGYKKIANDLSKENMKLAFENTILQSKIDKAIEYIEENVDLEMDDFTKIDIGCEILKILDLDKYNEFLKENE